MQNGNARDPSFPSQAVHHQIPGNSGLQASLHLQYPMCHVSQGLIRYQSPAHALYDNSMPVTATARKAIHQQADQITDSNAWVMLSRGLQMQPFQHMSRGGLSLQHQFVIWDQPGSSKPVKIVILRHLWLYQGIGQFRHVKNTTCGIPNSARLRLVAVMQTTKLTV